MVMDNLDTDLSGENTKSFLFCIKVHIFEENNVLFVVDDISTTALI
jgi:hypothetical protein